MFPFLKFLLSNALLRAGRFIFLLLSLLVVGLSQVAAAQGSRSQTDRSNANGTLQSLNRSMVGSIGGDVSIHAGQNAHISGSDVVAANDIGIVARNVTIDTGLDRNTATESHDFSQSGLTVGVGNPVVSAVQTSVQMTQAASQTSDPRMKVLAGITAGLAANNAWDAVQSGQTVLDKDGNNIANAADKVGGINVSVSLGSSRSHSESTQTGSRNFGSSVAAGNNLRIVATGDDATDGSHDEQGEGRHPESGNGNIVIAGSDIRAGNDATLIADNRIDLLAAQDTASQTSSNSSSSASVGMSFGLGNGGGGLTFNIAASQGRGNADGNDVGNINTHVTAGNTLTLQSEGDTNLKGAVASGKQVTADIGGDLNIESLQDTSTYDSQQSSAGFSVSFSPTGIPTGGSINGSQSKINSDYASVQEQSGIKAGDGGYQVNVEGDTTLKGAVIAASDQAIADGKTDFQTGGTLSMSDINNSASYQADASGYSAGVGSQLGASGGTGSASGDAQSVTESGIGVSTGKDTTNSIKPIFDVQTVTADVNAQVQITQAFSQVAPKAVGDYATGKLKEADNLRAQADKESDPAKRDELIRQADALTEAWKEGGSARVALHTAVGALGGGLEGALGAGTTALTVPAIAEQINKLDVPPEVKQVLILATGAAIGGAAGGTAGAATGLSQVGNNYLRHAEVDALLKNIRDCKGDVECINPLIRAAIELSKSRNPMDLLDTTLATDVAAGSADLNNAATDLGSYGFSVSGGTRTLFNINNTQLDIAISVPVLTAPPEPRHPFYDSYQGRQGANLSQSLPALSVVAVPAVVSTLGAGKMVTGAVLGGGFDAAGQYAQLQFPSQVGDVYRPWQTVVASITGAVSYPLAGTSLTRDILLGSVTNATNTAVTNSLYGRNDSVLWAAGLGGGFAGAGAIFGSRFPPAVGSYISNTIGGAPSFIPLPENKGNGQ